MVYLSFFLMFIRVLVFSTMLLRLFKWAVNIKFLSWGGKYLTLLAKFDNVTFGVLTMLLICFLYVFKYNDHYFGGSRDGIQLQTLINLFVGVMASLVCTGDYLLTLIFWEYLGVVRFFLILFYDKYLSLRSSIITLVSSRFGDVSIFLLIVLSCCFLTYSPIFGFILFFFIIFTKRASFPFISWLLEAMRAPTPVRSLVHSSTLVAAGVWFAMRYDFTMFFKSVMIFNIFLILTILITGISSFFFIDLKKIVALSTCNKISWCVLYLIFGDVLLSLFQLISHGVSKCTLFMMVGDVMRGRSGSQASNCVYSTSLYKNWSIYSLFCVILGLSGAPFIGVFFTKHFLILNFMNTENLLLFSCILLCVFLSYFYSFRLCAILVNLKSRVVRGVLYFFKRRLIAYFWLFIKFFICYILDERTAVKINVSLILILFQIICCFAAYFLYKRNFYSSWRRSLFGCDKLIESAYLFYNTLIRRTSLFINRWDSYIINLWSSNGMEIISIYTTRFLKILILGVFIFITCFIIIY